MAVSKVVVVDGNNLIVRIDRGVAGRGITDVEAVEIDNSLYLVFTFTDGTTETVGPVGTIQYIGQAPIVVNGSTISLSTVPVNLGGTGATTAANARTNLNAANQDTTISAGTGLSGGGSLAANRTLSIANTAVTAAAYGSASKTLTATVNAQGQLTALADTNIAITNTQISGLGTMSTQNATSVAITGGTITGITDLAVADGGTGASDASGARTNLGAAASAITITAGTGLSGGGDLSANRTLSIANTAVTAAAYGSASNTLTATVNAQGQLTALAATPIAIANTQVSGLGTMSTQNANSVTITGGTITGITDLAIADGGTGASNAADARTNLGLGTAAVLNAGVALGVATLDAGGTVPLSQIPASIQGGVSYQGSWNAATNTPTLTSSVGSKGYYYVVSVAGSTNLNGITDWLPGDWAIFNGSVWEQIDNTDTVASVNGYVGAVVLTAADVGAPPTTRTISAGTGLTGGGDLSANRTITLADTTVTAGAYGSASSVPNYTVNAQGQLTAAASTAIAIANTQVSGLGTMSTQNANAVAITGGTATLTSLTVNDNTTLGSSNTDQVTFTARIASEFSPTTNNTYDLGRNSHEWRDLYLTGTAYIDTLNADTADINGGTIDNTSVGATTPSTGAFTSVTSSTAIGTTSGGTGLSSFTANGVVYASSTSALATGSALTFDGTNFTAPRTQITTAGSPPASGAGLEIIGGTSPLLFAYNRGTSAYLPLNATASAFGWSISGASDSMVLNSAGNLGIGTSLPSALAANYTTVDIRGTSGGALRSGNATDSAYIYSDSNETNFATATNKPLLFGINGTEKLRLTATSLYTASDVNVGIGTSSTSQRLTIDSADTERTSISLSNSSVGGGFFNIAAVGSAGWLGAPVGSLLIRDSNAGVSRIVLDSAGNVGIGTSSPAYKLDVNGRTRSADVGLASSSNYYHFDSYSGSNFMGLAGGTSLQTYVGGSLRTTLDSAGRLLIGGTTTYDFNGQSNLVVSGTANNSTITIASTTDGYLAFADGTTGTQAYVGRISYYHALNQMDFWTNGTAKMYLDSAGNLGLGVTPSAWGGSAAVAIELQTFGAAVSSNGAGATTSNFSHGTFFNGTNWIQKAADVTGARYQQTGSSAGSSHQWFVAPNSTAGGIVSFTQAMTLDGSGNLLVGTTSAPNSGEVRQLLARAGSTYLQFQNTSAATGCTIGTSGENFIIFTNTNTIGGGGGSYTERARITSGGTLAINPGGSGINNPQTLLQIYGGGSTTTAGALRFGDGSLAGGSTNYWDIGRDNTATGTFTFTLNGVQKSYIDNTTGAYVAVSDQRLKTNIAPLQYGLDEVMRLEPVMYHMADQPNTDKKNIGLLAQQVKSVMDEAVSDLKDDAVQFYGLDKSGLVPVLVKAIQEQQAIIEDMKTRLAAAGI